VTPHGRETRAAKATPAGGVDLQSFIEVSLTANTNRTQPERGRLKKPRPVLCRSAYCYGTPFWGPRAHKNVRLDALFAPCYHSASPLGGPFAASVIAAHRLYTRRKAFRTRGAGGRPFNALSGRRCTETNGRGPIGGRGGRP